MKDVLVHVVLISFNQNAPEEKRRKIFDLYQTLGEDCGGLEAGIFYWKVANNLDLRKNVHLVEVAIFRDDAALQAFRVHLRHQELTTILREIANWKVGDYMDTFPVPAAMPSPPPVQLAGGDIFLDVGRTSFE